MEGLTGQLITGRSRRIEIAEKAKMRRVGVEIYGNIGKPVYHDGNFIR